MNRVAASFVTSAAALALAACADSPSRVTAPSISSSIASPTNNVMPGAQFQVRNVCDVAPAGRVRCHSIVRVLSNGLSPMAAGTPSGYNPVDLQAAYALSPTGGVGATIAIVDAFDDPNAEADLAVYRSQFGLPACTTANGCFKKVDQNGGTNYPSPDVGWAEEISLDLDMASAICPNCKIILVESNDNSNANIYVAVDRAAILGATTISNSYGGPEYSAEVTDQSHYNHPGIAVTVSSGDSGFGVEFPAASQYVTAVGGTTLTRNGGTFTETAWHGAGSGCSKYIPKQSWQLDAGCAKRTVADVSAVANPATGVSVYDTYGLNPGGWLVFGGTSVSAPIIAGVYALAGNANKVIYGSQSYRAMGRALNDVISGNNGSCGGSYLCTAVVGYDGPTGNGTPNGVRAF